MKSRKLIEMIFNSKQSFNVFPFRVFYLLINDSAIPLQAGFGVSIKNFKKAVDRNRIKRLAKESYRLLKNELKELLVEKKKYLVIFFIYSGKELPDYVLVSEKMKIALQRLINQVNEKPSSNT